MTTASMEEIARRIAGILEVPEERARPGVVLTDLVYDSFRLVELAIQLQEDYDVLFTQQDMGGVRTVADLAGLVQARLPGS